MSDRGSQKWQQAQTILEQAKKGKIRITPTQQAKLENLLRGYAAYIEVDTELKRTKVGLQYEKGVYLSKLWLLERLGAQNQWNQPFLVKMKSILYESNDEFELVSPK